MTTGENESSGEVKVSEALRDKLWEYLPAPARTAQSEVSVSYVLRIPDQVFCTWLDVVYMPEENELGISATERLEEATAAGGRHMAMKKWCWLDATTGKINGFGEDLGTVSPTGGSQGFEDIDTDLSGETTPAQRLTEAIFGTIHEHEVSEYESDFARFTQEKLDYLLRLFVWV